MGKLSEPLAANLKRLRRLAGVSQSVIAASAGVSKQTVINLERGKHSGRIDTVEALANALGVAPLELFSGGVPEPASFVRGFLQSAWAVALELTTAERDWLRGISTAVKLPDDSPLETALHLVLAFRASDGRPSLMRPVRTSRPHARYRLRP